MATAPGERKITPSPTPAPANAAGPIAAVLFAAWTLRIAADALAGPGALDPLARPLVDAASKLAIFVLLPLALIRALEGGGGGPALWRGLRPMLAWAIALGWPLALLALDRLVLGRAAPLLPGAITGAAAAAVLALIVTAATEEYAFRRVLLDRIAALGGPAVAILATSALFALIHWPGWILLSGLDIPGLLLPTLQILAFGAILGVVTRLAGSILPAIVMHVFNNLVAGALA